MNWTAYVVLLLLVLFFAACASTVTPPRSTDSGSISSPQDHPEEIVPGDYRIMDLLRIDCQETRPRILDPENVRSRVVRIHDTALDLFKRGRITFFEMVSYVCFIQSAAGVEKVDERTYRLEDVKVWLRGERLYKYRD